MSGALVNQCEIRLHFRGAERCQIRCDTKNLSEDGGSSPGTRGTSEEIQFVDLLSNDVVYRTQPAYGALVDDTTYLVYRMRTENLQNFAVAVTLYTYDPNAGPDGPHPVFGSSEILPATLNSGGSCGSTTLEIQGTGNKTMQLITVEYLIVRPTSSFEHPENPVPQKWDLNQGPLDMGHRGMGKCRSHKTPPNVLENTVKCFKMAASHGADYVEFDVQVTRDNQVVVFHDFICRIQNSSEIGTKEQNGTNGHVTTENNCEYRNAPVTDFTYKELRNLKATFLSNTAEHTDEEEEQLFPLLSEVFQKVNPKMGFNVEIKYPTQLKNGEPEDGLATFQDMNEYVDLILCEIRRHAADRRVLLSCFNPDVCVMLKLKQSVYPVQFLTQGEVERYDAFLDRRTRDVPIAINFAKAEGFMGINPISEYILKDLSLVKRATDQGLVVMCWGAENNDLQVIDTLKKNGVHVVIYDRLNEFIDSNKARCDDS